MFDVAPTELLLVAIVALLVIGPKDLPKAMRFVGYWVGRARGVARQFRSGFDSMVREAELAEMEKKWAEENARIMREHPVDPFAALPAPAAAAESAGEDAPPAMVERPVLAPTTDASPDLPPVSVEHPTVAPASDPIEPPVADKAPS